MITERDLEMQYHSDTGNFPDNGHGSYSKAFYEWCLDQLLILKNKENEKDNMGKS